MKFNRVNIKLIEDKPIDDIKNKAKSQANCLLTLGNKFFIMTWVLRI